MYICVYTYTYTYPYFIEIHRHKSVDLRTLTDAFNTNIRTY